MKLTVVIVNYNVKYYLDQCLDALMQSIRWHRLEAEVYVVDNHSKDGSVEYLRKRFSDVHFIESPHNLGFARANNIAIRKSEAEYVLLLNPDTVVGKDVIPEVLDFMDQHPDAGALGVHMIDAAGRSARESRRGLPSPMVAFYKMAGLCSCFPKSKRFGHYYMSDMPWDQAGRIEVVSGAFCMLRKSAIDQVGPLDEDFFMYGEDIDLSYRVLKGGYHNYYFPKVILHYKGESTHKSSFRYVHVFYEAMLIFFRKHYSGMTWLLSFPIKLAIYAKAALALSRMLVDKAQKNLGFVTYDKRSTAYLVVGDSKMQDACRELLQERGLQAEFLEVRGEGEKSLLGESETSLLGDLESSLLMRENVKSSSMMRGNMESSSLMRGNVKSSSMMRGNVESSSLMRGNMESSSMTRVKTRNQRMDEALKAKLEEILVKLRSVQTVHVVFDPLQFSYDTLFGYFSENPSVHRKLAFYHKETNRIVTDEEVFD